MELKHYTIEWTTGTMHYAHISDGNSGILFEGVVKKNYLTICHSRIHAEYAFSKAESGIFQEVISHYTALAKTLGITLVYFSKSTGNLFKFNGGNLLKDYGFYNNTLEIQRIAAFLGIEFNGGGWLLDERENIKQIANYHKCIRTLTKEKLELFLDKLIFSYEENTIISEIRLKDTTCSIAFTYEAGIIHVHLEKNTTFIPTSFSDFEEKLTVFLDEFAKKQRIRLLYNPPREYFDGVMNSNLISLEMSEQIHSELLKHMDALQIETISKRTYPYFQHLSLHRMLRFDDVIFLFANTEEKLLRVYTKDQSSELLDFCLANVSSVLLQEYEEKIKEEKLRLRSKLKLL